MLQKLIIQNVALISLLEMELDSGLNVLTGETGAGKSIIVDSLMLLLGGRYDKTLLKYGESEGYVTGVFTDVEPSLFESIGLEIDDTAIIKRRFNIDSKNDIRINGQSVTLSMLKRFSQRLVDIYGQNEYQSLAMPSKHLDILDFYVKGEIAQPLAKLEAQTIEYNEIKSKLQSIGDEEKRKRNIDVLIYQIEEIKKANIMENEEEELIERRRLLLSSERIKSSFAETVVSINGSESEGGAYETLQMAAKSLSHIASLSTVYDDLLSRINVVLSELQDISDASLDILDGLEFDNSTLDALEKRLDEIRNIKRKYGDYKSMTAFLQKSENELEFLQNADEMFEKLTQKSEKTRRIIYDESKAISIKRKQCAKALEQKVIAELEELGMKDSRFEIVFSDFPSFSDCEQYISKNGMDRAEFYLSANLGQPLLPLAKIISGGEMSRFMLALKVISGEADTVQTMIFDEIDAGVSGRIGQVIAQKLARISRKRQVLCVTHLPQIGAMADAHYCISKTIENSAATTTVERLEYNGMIKEISRLSGGQDISSQSLSNAKEMKEWNDNYKKII